MSRRSQRDIVFVERESSSPLWWLVVGGALGAGLALLFAPESGSKTRRLMARRLSRLRSTAEEVIGEFREAASSDADGGDENTEADEEAEEGEEEEEAEDEEEVEVEEVDALSARDELERRLAAARARRQRELADEDEEPVA